MKRGFTLTEMLVIIAVIGVLVGAAWPLLYPAQKRAQTKLDAQKIADELRLAQEQTLSEQDIFGVRLNGGTNTVTVVNYGQSYDGEADVATIVETKQLDSNVAIVDTTLVDPVKQTAEVRFAKTGTPSITGTVTVSNPVNDAGLRWIVEVTPSGLIKVHQ